MSEETLVKYCSPTLAGLKTAALFGYSFIDKTALRVCLCRWNRLLTAKGLRVVPLRYRAGRALIYMYRPYRLAKDLGHRVARRLLIQKGYRVGTADQMVVQLRDRVKTQTEFPHEIGLFLGYPPEDVCGFIRNRAQQWKYVGEWKVYGDMQAAQTAFRQYTQCRLLYEKQLANGCPLELLIVPEQVL